MSLSEPGGDAESRSTRLLAVVEGLLALEAIELQPTLRQASQLLVEVFDADKAETFLYDAVAECLVGLGTSDTPMGRLEHVLGLNRLPVASGGRPAHVFRSGESYLTGRADQDPGQLEGFIEGLGIRAQMICPLDVAGERRGVVAVASTIPDRYLEQDLRFLQTVTRWIGLVMHRIELLERQTVEQEYRHAVNELLAPLTPREKEVAELVARGFSNAEIGKELTITPGTAANHVRSILDKLQVRNRARIAAILTARERSQLDSEAVDR